MNQRRCLAVNHMAENNVVFQWDLKEVSGRLEIVSSVECGTNGIYFVEILGPDFRNFPI